MLLSSRKSEQSWHEGSETSFSDTNEHHEDYDDDEKEERFLSIPFIDNDENDEDSVNRRMSSSRLSRIVGYGVTAAVLSALIVFMALYIKSETTHDNNSDDDYIPVNACYEAPSCLNIDIKQVYNKQTGFTNNTGFNSPAASDNTCCNICPAGINSTVCFDVQSVEGYRNIWNAFLLDGEGLNAPSSNCTEKTGQMDYDYVMLDQIYYPQFCNALQEGHDPTLSHIAGTQCTESETSNGVPKLNIHGLWPNYYTGFPQCCDTNATKVAGDPLSVSTLDPKEVQNWSIYPLLQEFWYDPTNNHVNSDHIHCASCYVLNHEWQKHGSCFSPQQQEFYFASGLELHLYLTNHTRAVEAMNGSLVTTGNISDIYAPHRVNVICDPQAAAPVDLLDSPQSHSDVSSIFSSSSSSTMTTRDPVRAGEVGVFLEMQTCWDVEILALSVKDALNVSSSDSSIDGASSRQAAVSLIYDKSSGRVLANSLPKLRAILVELDEETLARMFSAMEIAHYYWVDCAPAGGSAFTEPCPKYTYVGNYADKAAGRRR